MKPSTMATIFVVVILAIGAFAYLGTGDSNDNTQSENNSAATVDQSADKNAQPDQ